MRSPLAVQHPMYSVRDNLDKAGRAFWNYAGDASLKNDVGE